MKFHVRVEPEVIKKLQRLPAHKRRKILEAILILEENPFFGKRLEGNRKGQYSLRVWPYRVIYIVVQNECIVVIIDVGHRQGVYY